MNRATNLSSTYVQCTLTESHSLLEHAQIDALVQGSLPPYMQLV